MLDHGADMYAMDPHDIYTPFTFVLSGNKIDLDVVRLFLDHDIDVNFQHNKSETALTMAAKDCKNFDAVKMLLRYGADPNIDDRYGFTTLAGLFRTCHDKQAYKKMLDLLKQ